MSEFEDEEEGLMPAAMLFFFASRDSLRHQDRKEIWDYNFLKVTPSYLSCAYFEKFPWKLLFKGYFAICVLQR